MVLRVPLRSVLAGLGRGLTRLVGVAPLVGAEDPEVAALVHRAEAAERAGRRDEARALYQEALGRRPDDLGALRGLRGLAAAAGAWAEALAFAERILARTSSRERSGEAEWVAGIHYELGRTALEAGRPAEAVPHLRSALRVDPGFLPAALALGDAYHALGDRREAVRAWERALDHRPALPLLVRLEQAYREDGRPGRIIAMYRSAVERAPEDLALAAALGRVYLELEMLDQAADQLEKVEVRAPELAPVHALLGMVFERRGQGREACEEYRRALDLSGAFEWPHRCAACGAAAPSWSARCARCGRWNRVRPVSGS
jgi:tetratricopeptide (TPR) repeat protein